MLRILICLKIRNLDHKNKIKTLIKKFIKNYLSSN